jgi:hypothetical protein
MGAHSIGPLASAIPITGTLALVGLLGVAILAMHVARMVAAAREPMFPDLAESALDPAAFARELAEGGTVADDAARFTDVAHHAGVNQAYALLALVNTDAPATPPATSSARASEPDPFAGLVDLTAPAPVDDTTIASPVAVGDERCSDCAHAPDGASVHPDDTLLPGRRTPFRRGHAA